MNDIEKALARIKRGIQLAVDAKDQEAIKELTTTKEALEKQIPVKADKEDEKDMKCPICGTWSSKIFEHQYCCYCGQRIVRSVQDECN